MSDREDSPRVSRSRSRGSDRSKKGRASKSRSRSKSKGSYKSRSRSESNHRGRSRTRSRSRHRSHSRSRRYRSRSRSPQRRSTGRRYSRNRSRSRSRSRGRRRRSSDDRGYGGGGRSHRSRSPMSRRKRHIGTREDPSTSRCLGVFGLSLYTQERDVREIFGRYGPIEEAKIIYDHNSGRSRGFAFLTMRHIEDAEEAKERAAGSEIDGHKIRVDYSITERAHTPTPGIYLGKPTSRGYRENGAGRRGSDYYSSRRSPSPSYKRSSRYSRSRSRSRSYSPRRY